MPKIVDHDERRAHIVAAVTQIIIRDGFDRVTMREIAAEAGYAHGAIARYFPDKKSLLTAAFLEVFQGSHVRTLERVEGVRGLEALRQMFLELLPFEQDGPQRSRVVLSFWDRAAQDPELWAIHHENILERRTLIRRFLIEAREDGELATDVNLEDAVNRVSVFNAGWQMQAVLVPEASDDASLRSSIDAMINSLHAARGAREAPSAAGARGIPGTRAASVEPDDAASAA